MTTPAIPSYPPDSPALIRLLLQREKARLLGPVIHREVVDDESGANCKALDKALEEIERAEKWVERCQGFEGY